MAFPILTRRPKKVIYELEENLLSSDSEAGYEHRRKKFTTTRKLFKVDYDQLKSADRDLIMTHFASVGQYATFDWTDLEGNVYSVYYDKPVAYESFVPGWFTFDTLELKEA